VEVKKRQNSKRGCEKKRTRKKVYEKRKKKRKNGVSKGHDQEQSPEDERTEKYAKGDQWEEG